MDELDIRAATQSDHRLFYDLNADVQRLHHGSRPDLFKAPSEIQSLPEEFTALLNRPGVSIWFAFQGDEPVGYVYVEQRDRPEDGFQHAQRVLYVHHLSVRPGARRKGVGMALMQQALTVARAAGVMRIELDVWGFNEVARQAFRALGYKPWIERLALELR